MSVFILYENDFGHAYVIGVFNSLDKARTEQAIKMSENTKDWISYQVEEWDVQ